MLLIASMVEIDADPPWGMFMWLAEAPPAEARQQAGAVLEVVDWKVAGEMI